MKPRMYALHGLRALAATMVAVTHLSIRLIKYDLLRSDWERLAMVGSAGVCTFFVISGFIMVRTSIDDFGKSHASTSFLTKRIIRVVPLYYIFTALFLIKLAATHEPVSIGHVALSVGFIPYVNEIGLMQPVYSLGWTLNYEMYFYLIFAASLSFKRPVGLAVMFILILAIVGIAQSFGVTPDRDPATLLDFYGSPIVIFFLVGVGIGLLPIPTVLSTAICLPLAITVLLCGVTWLDGTGQAFACVLAVFIIAWERPSARPGSTKRVVELLGESSYSLYLTHSFVLGPFVAVGIKLGIFRGHFGWISEVLAIFACIATSVVCYLMLEKPFLNYLRLTLIKRPRSVSASA